MNFNKLINYILSEGFWPKNLFKTSKKPSTPFIEPDIQAPSRKMDKKGWLKNNSTWIPVAGVHAKPVYINELNKERKDRPKENIVSRDALERCVMDGHTRVALNVDTIHIECRSLPTGKAALATLQRMFSDVTEKKVMIDVLNEASYEVDLEGKVLSRRVYGHGLPYTLS